MAEHCNTGLVRQGGECGGGGPLRRSKRFITAEEGRVGVQGGGHKLC